MPHPKVKLSDNLGNEVSVTNNKLDINVSYPTVAHGSMNVTGTATALPAASCRHVDIMATIANTGIVYIGASGVSATTGIGLYPGDVYSIDIEDTSRLYAMSTVSGDDINIVIYY